MLRVRKPCRKTGIHVTRAETIRHRLPYSDIVAPDFDPKPPYLAPKGMFWYNSLWLLPRPTSRAVRVTCLNPKCGRKAVRMNPKWESLSPDDFVSTVVTNRLLCSKCRGLVSDEWSSRISDLQLALVRRALGRQQRKPC